MNSQWQAFFETHTPVQCEDFSNLPALFVTPLPSFTAITMQGEESEKYLQGQLTADINNLPENQLSLAAHCDAKGKTWASYWVGKQNSTEFTLLTTLGAASKSLPELTKFSVFSKTEITESQTLLAFYIHGEQASERLQAWLACDDLNAVDNLFYKNEQAQLFKIGEQNFILLVAIDKVSQLLQQLDNQLICEEAFFYHEALAARPYLEEATSNQFVPQMMNLQALNAISFTKGCYIGQETVARMRYLGKNKRATFLVEVNSPISTLNAGDAIQRALGENWRNAGVILQSVSDSYRTYVLVVLPNDVSDEDTLRLESAPDAEVSLHSLPYSLNDE